MTNFSHVSRINVSLWGHRVGTIVELPRRGAYAFRYDRRFLSTGIQISPLMMPLRPEPYAFPELPRSDYFGLPPVFADSLPDTFGSSLIDSWLVSRGLKYNDITPLDRLAYIGRRAMGALTYEPDRSPKSSESALDLRHLVESARRVVNGELYSMSGDDALRTIVRLGSSAGGAQAKAIVGWNRKTGQFLFGDRMLPEGFEYWIIKFTPQEYPWRGEKEYELYLKAKERGIKMSESVLFELDGLKHFMTKRFDRSDDGKRHHILTLSAMAHFPNATPPEFRSYDQLFITADRLGLPYEEKEQLFKRMAFNAEIKECDDHTKNFSFILKEGGSWHLAPAYDLTGSAFPSTDPWSAALTAHQLAINGKCKDITKEDLLAVADKFAIGIK